MQPDQIFSGWVRHRRYQPHSHEFTYHSNMVLLDIEATKSLFQRCSWWSDSWPAPIQIRDSDYLPERPDIDTLPLADRARQGALDSGVEDVGGPVQLLAQPRHWGHSFNPVVFFFLHDQNNILSAIGAEITNTPWDERHTYWLPVSEADRRPGGSANKTNRQSLHFNFDKAFHVSPFLPMNLRYSWRFTLSANQIVVYMQVFRDEALTFDATLSLDGVPCNAANMRQLAWQFPGSTTTAIRIYWQALKLYLKRTPFFPHPERG